MSVVSVFHLTICMQLFIYLYYIVIVITDNFYRVKIDSYGYSGCQGWRAFMEDAHTHISGVSFGLANTSFFAVYDGHAGSGTSWEY